MISVKFTLIMKAGMTTKENIVKISEYAEQINLDVLRNFNVIDIKFLMKEKNFTSHFSCLDFLFKHIEMLSSVKNINIV